MHPKMLSSLLLSAYMRFMRFMRVKSSCKKKKEKKKKKEPKIPVDNLNLHTNNPILHTTTTNLNLHTTSLWRVISTHLFFHCHNTLQ